jgi:thiamine phosphate synthase YjbQ (UPF0047 family)
LIELQRGIPPSQSGKQAETLERTITDAMEVTLLGPSLTVRIANGKLVLGTWQQIFHLECDVRGRQRTVLVTVVGD